MESALAAKSGKVCPWKVRLPPEAGNVKGLQRILPPALSLFWPRHEKALRENMSSDSANSYPKLSKPFLAEACSAVNISFSGGIRNTLEQREQGSLVSAAAETAVKRLLNNIPRKHLHVFR